MKFTYIVEMEVEDHKAAEEAARFLDRDVELTLGKGRARTKWRATIVEELLKPDTGLGPTPIQEWPPLTLEKIEQALREEDGRFWNMPPLTEEQARRARYMTFDEFFDYMYPSTAEGGQDDPALPAHSLSPSAAASSGSGAAPLMAGLAALIDSPPDDRRWIGYDQKVVNKLNAHPDYCLLCGKRHVEPGCVNI